MEVKINKEIRDYTESMFFGLSLRQCVFSFLAVLMAVGIYFGLQSVFGIETTSWICIVSAAPFAAVGFIKYHGMTVEQFAWVWIKAEFLDAKRLPYKTSNLYYEAMKPYLENKQKEVFNCHD